MALEVDRGVLKRNPFFAFFGHAQWRKRLASFGHAQWQKKLRRSLCCFSASFGHAQWPKKLRRSLRSNLLVTRSDKRS